MIAELPSRREVELRWQIEVDTVLISFIVGLDDLVFYIHVDCPPCMVERLRTEKGGTLDQDVKALYSAESESYSFSLSPQFIGPIQYIVQITA